MINETKKYSIGYVIETIASLITSSLRSKEKNKKEINSKEKKRDVIWYTWS